MHDFLLSYTVLKKLENEKRMGSRMEKKQAQMAVVILAGVGFCLAPVDIARFFAVICAGVIVAHLFVEIKWAYLEKLKEENGSAYRAPNIEKIIWVMPGVALVFIGLIVMSASLGALTNKWVSGGSFFLFLICSWVIILIGNIFLNRYFCSASVEIPQEREGM